MPVFSSIIFGVVQWAARKGLRGEPEDALEASPRRGSAAELEAEEERPRGERSEETTVTKENDFGSEEQLADRVMERKFQARKAGVRGETYAYWYLRRLGYVFVARNYVPRGVKGEIDLIGYDGKTLAFVEVRTRTVTAAAPLPGLPELSVTKGKQRVVVRTAWRFLSERHLRDCPCRFDVLAIDNRPGRSPVVRLHKDAFRPELRS